MVGHSDKDSKWLERYLHSTGVKGTVLHTPDVPTVEKAMERVGCEKRQIFKSVVFISETGKGYIAVVDGDSKVDKSKLEKLVGEKLRIASKDEVKRLTGYDVGGVSPFGVSCEVFVDERVFENELVYGGGDSSHLIEISPEELLKVGNRAKIRK
jgi:prolyl-tRNA editing enzyme YbaK/EbsC (Cys-tRNA(Pro) deacylase)